MTTVNAVAAIIVDGDKRVLMADRPADKPMPGLWEFPGGKIEPNETPAQSLVRELKEELDLNIVEGDLLPLTFMSHDCPDFHLILLVYLCQKWQGTPRGVEGQNLKWMHVHELDQHAMPPADEPLRELLKQILV